MDGANVVTTSELLFSATLRRLIFRGQEKNPEGLPCRGVVTAAKGWVLFSPSLRTETGG